MSMVFVNGEFQPYAFEAITVSTTATGPAAANVSLPELGGYFRRAIHIFISVDTNPVRFRWDGTDPTATVGHKFLSGDVLVLEGYDLISKLRMIRDTSAAADAVVSITYSRVT